MTNYKPVVFLSTYYNYTERTFEVMCYDGQYIEHHDNHEPEYYKIGRDLYSITTWAAIFQRIFDKGEPDFYHYEVILDYDADEYDYANFYTTNMIAKILQYIEDNMLYNVDDIAIVVDSDNNIHTK